MGYICNLNNMATDGVGIIDGDFANDIYGEIIELYDCNFSIDEIENKFPLDLLQSDDFDTEIYTTACALAYWKIGISLEKYLEFIQEIISKGACEKYWNDEESVKEGKKRKKTLERFFLKISQKNEKPIARKKKIKKPFCNPDAMVQCQLDDNSYIYFILLKFSQSRSENIYIFSPIQFKSNDIQTIGSIEEKFLMGRKIGLSQRRDEQERTSLLHQPSIKDIWNYDGGNDRYSLELLTFTIEHKDLIRFKNKFKIIGDVNICSGFKDVFPNNIVHCNNYEEINDFFNEYIGFTGTNFKGYRYKYPLKLFINRK
ncbi:MAG: hypothetical protein GY828_05715 [Candidatus Gracilibacteria bacterium]|nr:hypothetical protein [Candidatus Gracilibacteria bacterium]